VQQHRIHVVLDDALVSRIDSYAGRRGRSQFLAEAAALKLLQLKQVEALEAAAGAWVDALHPELKGDSAAFIQAERNADETARGAR
jgi:metal-responsive CopG/Arc/MetJ family transcriptional regulator